MAFELRPGGDLAQEIRRIGREQLGIAISELTGSGDRHRAVHEARKSLKRTRSLLRLARPALAKRASRKHNQRLRDVARGLSVARDWQAMIETVTKLETHFGPEWNPDVTGGLRAIFHGRQQRGELHLGRAIDQAVGRIDKVRRRIWELELDANRLSLGRGIEHTYADARRRFKLAYAVGEGTTFHEWRKDAQRHWRHMQLMVAAWPEAMAVRVARSQALSQALGDDHDIHVLLGHLRATGPELAGWSDLERFYDGCVERQCALRLAARNHGTLLFAEPASAFRRRMTRYWRAAQSRFAQGAPAVAAPESPEEAAPPPELPKEALPKERLVRFPAPQLASDVREKAPGEMPDHTAAGPARR